VEYIIQIDGRMKKKKKAHEAIFKDIGEANDVLSDPNKRSQYDNGADLNEMNSGMGGMGGFNMGDIFEMFGNSGMGGGRGNSGFSFSFGGDDKSKKSRKRNFDFDF